MSKPNPVTRARYRAPDRSTEVTKVMRQMACGQRDHIDEKISAKHLVSPCQALLELSYRTARCGSVRKPAAYRVRPEALECWRGWTQGTDRGVLEESVCRKREMSPAVCTYRGGPGKPGDTPGTPWRGPSNSYFEGPRSLMLTCLYPTVGPARRRHAASRRHGNGPRAVPAPHRSSPKEPNRVLRRRVEGRTSARWPTAPPGIG